MKIKLIFAVGLLTVLAFTSCDRLPFTQFPDGIGLPTTIEAYVVGMTQTAAVTPLPVEASSTPTIEPAQAVTSTTATEMPGGSTQTPSLPCDAAAAGRPIDVTIPDDTIIPAGTSFTKVWRLVNAGSCPWTMDYAVVWFSGDQLGPVTAQNLSHDVKSGETIDIPVDMNAPASIGVKQSYWKLRNADAELFGIGPAGNAPFWVRIIVADISLAAPTLTPEPTATSVTLIQGSLDLLTGESLNLDSGEKVELDLGDLALVSEGSQLVIKPTSSAILGLAGEISPSQADCRLVLQGSDALIVADQVAGAYYCYQTDQGLPGVARLVSINPDSVRLDFLTWAVP